MTVLTLDELRAMLVVAEELSPYDPCNGFPCDAYCPDSSVRDTRTCAAKRYAAVLRELIALRERGAREDDVDAYTRADVIDNPPAAPKDEPT